MRSTRAKWRTSSARIRSGRCLRDRRSPYDVLGELVCARIVPVEGTMITGEEVEDFARDTVAGYKDPDLVRFFDELPITGSGR